MGLAGASSAGNGVELGALGHVGGWGGRAAAIGLGEAGGWQLRGVYAVGSAVGLVAAGWK